MTHRRESEEVRLAKAHLARRFVEALLAEKQAQVRIVKPRPTGLDEWLKANERAK